MGGRGPEQPGKTQEGDRIVWKKACSPPSPRNTVKAQQSPEALALPLQQPLGRSTARIAGWTGTDGQGQRRLAAWSLGALGPDLLLGEVGPAACGPRLGLFLRERS